MDTRAWWAKLFSRQSCKICAPPSTSIDRIWYWWRSFLKQSIISTFPWAFGRQDRIRPPIKASFASTVAYVTESEWRHVHMIGRWTRNCSMCFAILKWESKTIARGFFSKTLFSVGRGWRTFNWGLSINMVLIPMRTASCWALKECNRRNEPTVYYEDLNDSIWIRNIYSYLWMRYSNVVYQVEQWFHLMFEHRLWWQMAYPE